MVTPDAYDALDEATTSTRAAGTPMLRVAQAATLHNVCFAVSEPARGAAAAACRDTNPAAKAAGRKTVNRTTPQRDVGVF